MAHSYSQPLRSLVRNRPVRRLRIEALERRNLLAAELLSSADISLPRPLTAGVTSIGGGNSVSSNGRYVVFASDAANIVPNDTNQASDVFRLDRQSGNIELVSVSGSGGPANGPSFSPSISDDGMTVAFVSDASDLAPIDQNGRRDIFFRDLSNLANKVQLVSINASGTASGDSSSNHAVISGDGSTIAFTSNSSDLVAVDSGGQDVFARKIVGSPVTHLVSINAAGTDSGNGSSSGLSISQDGNTISFSSTSTDLVPSDTNNERDVFARSLVGIPSTVLISVNAFGNDSGNGESHLHRISGDGSTVVFASEANDLGATDTNGVTDVYARTLGGSPSTLLVSVNDAGTDSGNGATEEFGFDVSHSGSFVVFASSANDLVASDTNGFTDVFLRRLSGIPDTFMISLNSAGNQGGNGHSIGASISADGKTIGYRSTANDLVANDNNQDSDVFVRGTGSSSSILVSHKDSSSQSANGFSQGVAVSADGSTVRFVSDANDIAQRDYNAQNDLFVHNVASGNNELVSKLNTALPTSVTGASDSNFSAAGAIGEISFSADGRYAVFQSGSENLVPNDNNGEIDVFRYDRLTNNIDLVSENLAGNSGGNGRSTNAVISADGMFVAFQSFANDLETIDSNNREDVFIRDFTGTPVTRLLSVNSAGTNGGSSLSQNPQISADGSKVAFESRSADLVSTDTNGSKDIFVASTTGLPAIELVSINSSGTGSGNGESERPVINADGTVVAFQSDANNLVSIDTNNAQDIFARSIGALGSTVLVSVNKNGTNGGDRDSSTPSISADGLTIAFQSRAADLVEEDTDSGSDIFIRKLSLPFKTELVNFNAAGDSSSNSVSSSPKISADGSTIVFTSSSSDLIPGVSGFGNIFAKRLSGPSEIILVSKNFDGTNGGNDTSSSPSISNDGTIVVFQSDASDLVEDDNNNQRDVFVKNLSSPEPLALVSSNSLGDPNSLGGEMPRLSGDGSILGFASDSNDIVASDFNNSSDVFASTISAIPQFTVTNKNDSGAGSLRDAILQANHSGEPSKILFHIPGNGLHLINLQSPLPAITAPVFIDGTSEPEYVDSPRIGINGSFLSGTPDGLKLQAAGSGVKGLAIYNFSGDGIELNGDGGYEIRDNYLGLTPGEAIRGNQIGLRINGAALSVVDGNTISGNLGTGVVIDGAGAESNRFINNKIGTNPDGTTANANQGVGILIQTPNNVIGSLGQPNIISGNESAGISVGSAAINTLIGHNKVGTSADGMSAIANRSYGVLLRSSSATVQSNTISGNQRHGVIISGASAINNLVSENNIGTDSMGDAAIGNQSYGIYIASADSNTIDSNLVSGNLRSGIVIANGENNTIESNRVGSTSFAPIGNGGSGIFLLSGSTLNTIDSNDIVANSGTGVTVIGQSTTSNDFINNHIGIETGETSTAGNGSFAMLISSPSQNVRDNVVVGSTRGIVLSGPDAFGTTIMDNYIGTDNAMSDFGMTTGIQFAKGAADNEVRSNDIRHNDTGIRLLGNSGSMNQLISNTFSDQSIIDIDLSSLGPTPNDLDDADEGPNRGMNFPEIQSATLSSSSLNITFSIPTLPANANFPLRVQFYELTGQTKHQFNATIYDASDQASGVVTKSVAASSLSAFSTIAAITIDADGNTSEFSGGTLVTPPSSFNSALGFAPLGSSPLDASGDGVVSPFDALMVMNGLANAASGESNEAGLAHLDVNRDGKQTPFDALAIVNWLGFADRHNQNKETQHIGSLIDQVITNLADEELMADIISLF